MGEMRMASMCFATRGAARNGGAAANMMTTDIDRDAVAKVYARWAPVYDLVFGAVFERGRRAAIAASERVGGRILEVGVGTGISFPITPTAAACLGSISPRICC